MNFPSLATPVRNHLLKALAPDDLDRLQPHLERVSLEHKQTLAERNGPITHAYFPEAGIASVLVHTGHGEYIEVGLIGRDGMVGLPLVHNVQMSAHLVFVQVPGEAWRIRAADLLEAMRESGALRTALLHHAEAFTVQAAQTGGCNGTHELEERLARWLLLALDRVDGDDLSLTHEFLGQMLAVRRSGVSIALKRLQRDGIIGQGRGHITVLDRAALEEVSCECHRISKNEFGWLLDSARPTAPDGLTAPESGEHPLA